MIAFHHHGGIENHAHARQRAQRIVSQVKRLRRPHGITLRIANIDQHRRRATIAVSDTPLLPFKIVPRIALSLLPIAKPIRAFYRPVYVDEMA